MTIRDDLSNILTQPQYSLTIWAVLFIVITGVALLCYSNQIMLEIETDSNLIEAASRW